MKLLIKKVFLGGIMTLFASCSAFNGSGWNVQNNSVNESINLSGWSSEHSTSTPHTCDKTTHTHEAFITYHENYDKYVEYCINKETRDYIANENFIYHDEMNTSDLNSSSHTINNPDLTASHDPLSDFTLETRRQEIEENQIAQIDERNKD